jgi:glucosamine-6-phosphate deaminase
VKVTVFENERILARTLAVQIAASLGQNPSLVLGLPTGRTPIRLYHELGSLHKNSQADCSRATTFNLDEFVGVTRDDPGSYYTFMREHLFSRVNLHPSRINFLDGSAPDLDAECRRYEHAIAAAGGIDLQLLGIGTNGHIGFNEPARELVGPTHRVRLKESTRRSNAALFGGEVARVPKEALSMGVATILKAKADRAHRDGEVEGAVRRARVERSDHDEAARLVPPGAPGCGIDAGCRRGGPDGRLAIEERRLKASRLPVADL